MRCPQCPLQDRPCIDPAGNFEHPRICFVGEAPGYHEAQEGKPFVGPSGKLLRQIVQHLEIPIEEIYVTNAIMCHPPENRDPSAREITACAERLSYEMAQVQPSFIIALGKVAGKAVFNDFTRVDDFRGRVRTTRFGVPGMLTSHPAACLYPNGDTLLPSIISHIRRGWRIVTGAQNELQTMPTVVEVVHTPEQFTAMCTDLTSHPLLFFDWETTGVDPRNSCGFCLGLCAEPGRAYALPMSVVRERLGALRQLMRHVALGAFNSVFDLGFNQSLGLSTLVVEDPMLAHYVLDERPQRRSLENLSMEFCDAVPYESNMLDKYQCTKADFLQKVPAEEIYEYCGRDADYSLRLHLIFKQELQSTPSLASVYRQILIPTVNTLRRVRANGLWVDKDRLKGVTEEYTTRHDTMLAELQGITGEPSFNPNSHQQVAKQVWDIMSLPEPDLYQRKPRSVDDDTRKALLEQYPDNPFVKTLHEYKIVQTLLSRYLTPLPEYIEDDGRVRCEWHQDRTETGRLATTRPALHQTPREGSIRSIFAAPPGRVLVKADYRQGEIRMAAHIAGDAVLTGLLKSGVDFHTKMASQAFGVPIDLVTPEQRQAAKEVSFGLLYLMGDAKLAASTGLPHGAALEFVHRYKAQMPAVQRWILRIKDLMQKKRYVESPFGRRRRFYLLTDGNFAKLHREAVNMPIQSGLSDLTTHAMNRMQYTLDDHYPEARIVLHVHDALVIECPEAIAQEIAALLKAKMMDVPLKTDVPFEVDVKIGSYWS